MPDQITADEAHAFHLVKIARLGLDDSIEHLVRAYAPENFYQLESCAVFTGRGVLLLCSDLSYDVGKKLDEKVAEGSGSVLFSDSSHTGAWVYIDRTDTAKTKVYNNNYEPGKNMVVAAPLSAVVYLTEQGRQGFKGIAADTLIQKLLKVAPGDSELDRGLKDIRTMLRNVPTAAYKPHPEESPQTTYHKILDHLKI